MIDHHQAQRLLADDAFKSAIADLRTDLTDDWKRTGPNDADKRENLWRMLQAVDRLEEKLNSYVLNGKIAERSRA